jgi:lipoate-protein ligase A
LTLRLLDYEAAGGAANMAADEAMLDSAVAGIASIRFYGWAEATLSLGYFQSEAIRRHNPHLSSLPYVRRPTGGAALVHENELTYALALPSLQVRHEAPATWITRVHSIIAEVLNDHGVPARLSEPTAVNPNDHLCFKKLTCGDILIGRDKIVGSAQRRQRGALLQHGGILLAQSAHAPDLAGVYELSGRHVDQADLSRGIVQSLTSRLTRDLTPGTWTDGEKKRRAQLVETKYSQASWNAKR